MQFDYIQALLVLAAANYSIASNAAAQSSFPIPVHTVFDFGLASSVENL
jgi:hypothetical protein